MDTTGQQKAEELSKPMDAEIAVKFEDEQVKKKDTISWVKEEDEREERFVTHLLAPTTTKDPIAAAEQLIAELDGVEYRSSKKSAEEERYRNQKEETEEEKEEGYRTQKETEGGEGYSNQKGSEGGERKQNQKEGTEEEVPKQKQHSNACKDENGFTYYKCRFCGLTFNFMTTLKAHERVHDVNQPYTCNKCGEAFHYMCELEYHAKTHLKQKGYKCECGRTFFQYTDLLYHKHPGEDEPPYPALPMPSMSSVSISGAGAEMPSPPPPPLHPAEFPTPEFAEQGFEPKYPLRRGLSDVRAKPYICQYCSKSYADSRGLAYHMYSHRGERIFNPRASRYLMCRNDNSYISSGIDLRDA